MRRAQEIYRRLYSERCKQSEEGVWGYEGFKWSGGWFNGFRERYHLGNRASTKQAQQAPDEMRPVLRKWPQFNRRQPYIRHKPHMSLVYGDARSTDLFGPDCVERFKLFEIANMDQTPISFEFLDKRTYEKKGAETV